MRVGEREDPTKTRNTDYALIMEDINLDSSSFVLSTNQLIEFKFASNDDVYFRSAGALNKNPLIRNNETKLTSLSNNQSLLNSGRVILTAKTENIIFSAQQDLISKQDESIEILLSKMRQLEQDIQSVQDENERLR